MQDINRVKDALISMLIITSVIGSVLFVMNWEKRKRIKLYRREVERLLRILEEMQDNTSSLRPQGA